MALSAQDKILYVANKLGLSTLGQMQGSTGAVYDSDINNSGILFGNASQHANPQYTNLTQNKFEVNEALLIETIAWYSQDAPASGPGAIRNLATDFADDRVIVFDVVIGNKRVVKEQPVFVAGSPYTFANGLGADAPRHQVFMEGAGILIPPQVEFYINYKMYSVTTGSQINLSSNKLGAYLFGTKVNLNFNTSI